MALSIEARTLSIDTKMTEAVSGDGIPKNTRNDNDAFSIRIRYPHDTDGVKHYAMFLQELIALIKKNDANAYFDEYLQTIH